jgi:hypothetical protein
MARNHLASGVRDLWKIVPARAEVCTRQSRALQEPLGRKAAVAPASALGTDKAVGPAHPDERGVAQILAAVEPAELGHAGPFRT